MFYIVCLNRTPTPPMTGGTKLASVLLVCLCHRNESFKSHWLTKRIGNQCPDAARGIWTLIWNGDPQQLYKMLVCALSDLPFRTVQAKGGVLTFFLTPLSSTTDLQYSSSSSLLLAILVRGDRCGGIAVGFGNCFESNVKYQVSSGLGFPCYLLTALLVIPLQCNLIHKKIFFQKVRKVHCGYGKQMIP